MQYWKPEVARGTGTALKGASSVYEAAKSFLPWIECLMDKGMQTCSGEGIRVNSGLLFEIVSRVSISGMYISALWML